MTSRFPVASDLPQAVVNTESATTRIAEEGPYARPTLPPHRAVDAVLIDAIRASVGPFVPAQWRTVSAASTPAAGSLVSAFDERAAESVEQVEQVEEAESAGEAEALPWIESFLDAPDEGATEPAADSVAAATSEAWPLEEAGEVIRAIADDLSRHADASTPKLPADAASAAPDATAPAQRMWSEDDMMDIMPVKAPGSEATGAEPWAARARRESEDGSPESAAKALEALASRVRSGEIQLPMFSAEMGEAAALAAALAALLNLRR